MKPRTIKTREIIEDIQSGMGDVPIMEKYELAPTEFLRILDKLEKVSAVPLVTTQARKRSIQAHHASVGKRILPRSYALFSIAVHDAKNLGVTGTINDITEKGLQTAGISVEIGERKTFVIRSDVFAVHPPLVMKATCRWVKRPAGGDWIAGFEITAISGEDLKGLRTLIGELTITSFAS
jgi:hypothetical protein